MKKKLILIAGIAIALAACTKNELRDDSTTTEPVSWPSVITVATEPVVDSETKSVISDGGAFSWFAGTGETAEKLGINTDAGFKVYTCTDAATGTFGGDLEGKTPSTVAVYPAGQYVLSTKALTVKMPESYEYVPTLAKTPMIAQIAGSIDNLAFKHIAALLKVSVKNVPPTATQLVLETDENIAGDFVISDCTVADAVITNAGGSVKSVAVNFPAGGDFSDKDFFIPIPTGTYDHFNLFLKDENGNILAGRKFLGKKIERKDLASGDAISLPQLQLSDAIVLNDTQIGLRWSENAFATTSEAVADDKAPAYTFGIYSDAACTSKLWDWETAKNAEVFTSTPGHVFSGLTPETTYYIKVKDATNGIAAVKAFTTEAEKAGFVKPTTAAAGEEIVFESFNDVLWGGGDVIQELSGVNIKNWTDALGTPETSSNGVVCDDNDDRNMLTNAHESTTSIGYNWFNSKPVFGWSAYVLSQSNARVSNFPTTLAGVIKFGGSERKGYIITPELSSLSGRAKVNVSFKAGALVDGQKAYVAIFPKNAASVDSKGVYLTVAPEREIEVATIANDGAWHEYSVAVELSAGQRIGIGTKISDAGTAGDRYFMTEASISLDSYVLLGQKLVFANDTQIGVRWSVTDFSNNATDKSKAYEFGIYSDSACESKLWGFTATANNSNFASYPAFVFTGLNPATSYWVKIANTTDSTENISEYHTAEPNPNFVNTATTAVAGDVILKEDFNDLIWGGRHPDYCAGTQLSDYKGNFKRFIDGGTNVSFGSYSNSANVLYYANNTATAMRAWLDASSLKNWKLYGNYASSIFMNHAGSIRFHNVGFVVSPVINCLEVGKTAKVRVTFNAAGNSGNDDEKALYIAVITASTYNASNDLFIDKTDTANNTIESVSSPVSLKKIGSSWRTYTVDDILIQNGQRIAIGSPDGVTTYQSYLDDIKVELVSYDD